MRLILSALLTLLLAACATQGSQNAGNAPGAATTANSSTEVDPTLRQVSAEQTIDLDHSSVDTLAGPQADLWVRIRAGFQLPDLDDDLVQNQLNWYTSRPDYVQRMTDRSQKYLYHIVAALEARHMPTELALLPFVESAYNPQALSVAKAAGMWQFVPDTGRDYKLKQNMFQDQRRDVLASTNAALDHLSRLHDMFGDWYLALAAYNWGEGNVQRAIARNQAAGLPTDYLSLKMPAETRNYVPKLQAVKDIIAHPELYGLSLPAIPNRPYFVTVKTSHDIDVEVAARLAGLSLDEFKALNPSFKQPLIVGSSGSPILLPFDNAQNFEKNLKSYDGQLSSWTTYTVTSRETPAALAQRIGVDLETLVSVNKIPTGMRLRSGSTLLVPKNADSDEDISADVVENAVLSVEPDLPDTHKVFLRVKRSESVAQIALRYGVSIAQVQSWNRTRKTSFKPGQVVLLHLPVNQALPVDPPRLIQAQASHGEAAPLRGGILRVSDPVGAASGPLAAVDKRSLKSAGRNGAARVVAVLPARGDSAAKPAAEAKMAGKNTARAPLKTDKATQQASQLANVKSAKPSGRTSATKTEAAPRLVARQAGTKPAGRAPLKANADSHAKPVVSADKSKNRQDG
jgi:membrane-bound lytic murein transglycosylase D